MQVTLGGWHLCHPASSTEEVPVSPSAPVPRQLRSRGPTFLPRSCQIPPPLHLRLLRGLADLCKPAGLHHREHIAGAFRERATSCVTKPAVQKHDATCSSYRISAFFFFFPPMFSFLVGWNYVTHVGSDAPTRPRGCGAGEQAFLGRTVGAGTHLPAPISHRSPV